MTTVLTATEARVHLGEVMDRVAETGERIIIEHRGKHKVALIPVEDLAHLPKTETPRDPFWERWHAFQALLREELGDKPLDPDPVEMIRRVRNEEFE